MDFLDWSRRHKPLKLRRKDSGAFGFQLFNCGDFLPGICQALQL
jgi:hypothetical protein